MSRAADLVGLRAAAAARLEALVADFDGVIAATAGANTDDEHDPEGATIAFERSQLAALIAQARARVAELDYSLERRAQGLYGICEVCGRPIPKGRLEARPTATRCIDHAI
jgi:DnaK suppressor protein